MFLSIAALTKSDQDKVMVLVKRLGAEKKTGYKRNTPRPKAGFLKGAFQAPVELPEENDHQNEDITDNQTEL